MRRASHGITVWNRRTIYSFSSATFLLWASLPAFAHSAAHLTRASCALSHCKAQRGGSEEKAQAGQKECGAYLEPIRWLLGIELLLLALGFALGTQAKQ